MPFLLSVIKSPKFAMALGALFILLLLLALSRCNGKLSNELEHSKRDNEITHQDMRVNDQLTLDYSLSNDSQKNKMNAEMLNVITRYQQKDHRKGNKNVTDKDTTDHRLTRLHNGMYDVYKNASSPMHDTP